MKRAPEDFVPMVLKRGGPLVFPDPVRSNGHGLCAVGGDLTAERLLLAYQRGIFPWFDSFSPPLWWSPDPRCILPIDSLHVPRRLSRRLRRVDFDITWDQEFEHVVRACSSDRTDGTWITEEMIGAYVQLNEQGHAHSLEVWQEGAVVGGIYGVQVGALFSGESKFRRRTDMSKIAFVAMIRTLARAGVTLLDVQFQTEHLAQFGCIEVPRALYLELARHATAIEVDLSDPPIVL